MAGSVNKVILVGNLGRDPEVRHSQSDQKIVNLRIATSERWKDRQSGDPRERTEWHSVVIFNENLAAIAERYLRKGSPVYVEGQLQTRKWTDQGGQERSTTEVVLSRFRGELTLLGGARGRRDRDRIAGGCRRRHRLPLPCPGLRPVRARAADGHRGAARRRHPLLRISGQAMAGLLRPGEKCSSQHIFHVASRCDLVLGVHAEGR